MQNSVSQNSNSLLIAGLDEVGRGPWAGPLVACAYIEINTNTNLKITDSKRMNQSQREKAFSFLINNGYWGVGSANPCEIDKFGLIKANNLAFMRAIENLRVKPDLILIDGRDQIAKSTTKNIPYKTIIHGDLLIRAISCASIIAKVTRDRLMIEYSLLYPEYRFENHKGYGTIFHRNALKKYGICKIHRISYKPIKEIIKKFSKLK